MGGWTRLAWVLSVSYWLLVAVVVISNGYSAWYNGTWSWPAFWEALVAVVAFYAFPAAIWWAVAGFRKRPS